MPNMQVNWLLALYIDLPGLLEDPRFCFVTQSSLTPGVDILAVSANQVFWYSPECTFMRALDAKLLRPNARMQRLVHNWINSTFKQKEYTAVHFRGKMTSCRESWPRDRHRNNMPMTIESIREIEKKQEIFLMTDHHCAALVKKFTESVSPIVHILLPNSSIRSLLRQKEAAEGNAFIEDDSFLGNLNKFDNERSGGNLEINGAVAGIFFDMLIAAHSQANIFIGTWGSTVTTVVELMRASRGQLGNRAAATGIVANWQNRFEGDPGSCFEGKMECGGIDDERSGDPYTDDCYKTLGFKFY